MEAARLSHAIRDGSPLDSTADTLHSLLSGTKLILHGGAHLFDEPSFFHESVESQAAFQHSKEGEKLRLCRKERPYLDSRQKIPKVFSRAMRDGQRDERRVEMGDDEKHTGKRTGTLNRRKRNYTTILCPVQRKLCVYSLPPPLLHGVMYFCLFICGPTLASEWGFEHQLLHNPHMPAE